MACAVTSVSEMRESAMTRRRSINQFWRISPRLVETISAMVRAVAGLSPSALYLRRGNEGRRVDRCESAIMHTPRQPY